MDTPQSSKSSGPRSDRLNSRLLNNARIYTVQDEARFLDPTQLSKLEQSFRSWSDVSTLSHVRSSRKRILLIFLLIRYTGARLNEVLTLDLRKCLDVSRRSIRYDRIKDADSSSQREVQISFELISEIQTILNEPAFSE